MVHAQVVDELETFFARGRVARVIQVDQRDVDVLARGDVLHPGRRRGGGDGEGVAREH
jgi:hypothetical protein